MSRNARVAATAARIRELEEEIGLLKAELSGLRVEFRHLKSDGSPDRAMNLTDLVEEILEGSDEPMRTRAILDVVASRVPEAGAKSVRATLSQLEKHGRAIHVSHGIWRAPGSAVPQSPRVA